jgi:hypothetical protein
MRRIAVLSGLVLVGGLLGPSTAYATQDGGHHHDHDKWIAVEDGFAVVLPDGKTFTDDTSGPTDELPPVGSRLFISEVLHKAEHGNKQGDEVGRTHIECTAQVVEGRFLCDAAFAFDSGSQLIASAGLDFSSDMGPESFDIAVTGGTGDYFGATGVLTVSDISDDPEKETVSLYESDLVLPHD